LTRQIAKRNDLPPLPKKTMFGQAFNHTLARELNWLRVKSAVDDVLSNRTRSGNRFYPYRHSNNARWSKLQAPWRGSSWALYGLKASDVFTWAWIA
jgi:hypothetical protein